MFKKIIMLLFFVLLVSSLAVVFYVKSIQPSSENPVALTKVKNAKGYRFDNRPQWKKPANSIKQVKVVRDEPHFLDVKIDFTYAGEQGKEVSTCGGILESFNKNGVKWSCRPTRLKKGEQSVMLHFELLDDRSEKFECTNYVELAFYKHQGSDFHRDYYRYKKAWLKDETGLLGQFKQFFYKKFSCE